MQKIDEIYKNLLLDICNNGVESEDKRLFHCTQPPSQIKMKAINGACFQIDLQKDGFPLISLRKINIKAFIAETIWFLTGDNKTESFLKKHTKIWEDFTESDGTVTSYGHRWRKHFGRDQVTGVLQMLQIDSSSRHGVIVTWDAATDSLSNGIKRANVPCQIALAVNIMDNKLNLHSIWRAEDMILGFPYDIAGNALLAHILAAHLNIEVGSYTHYIANAHIYQSHYHIADTLLERQSNQEKIALTGNSNWFERGSNGDDDLVNEIVDIFKKQYVNFGEPIDNIKIVI